MQNDRNEGRSHRQSDASDFIDYAFVLLILILVPVLSRSFAIAFVQDSDRSVYSFFSMFSNWVFAVTFIYSLDENGKQWLKGVSNRNITNREKFFAFLLIISMSTFMYTHHKTTKAISTKLK